MPYTDKTVECVECGATFTFTVAEQELHASRGYVHEPKRCPTCRQARKSQRGGGFGGGGFGGGGADTYRSRRQMFPAVCAQCGKETQVPFEPREGRPVYCSSCFEKVRAVR